MQIEYWTEAVNSMYNDPGALVDSAEWKHELV
jgi:hypothetical protein